MAMLVCPMLQGIKMDKIYNRYVGQEPINGYYRDSKAKMLSKPICRSKVKKHIEYKKDQRKGAVPPRKPGSAICSCSVIQSPIPPFSSRRG